MHLQLYSSKLYTEFLQSTGETKHSHPGLNKLISKPAYLPVVVHVAQLVGKPLHVIRLQSTGVVHNIVVGWGDASIANSLAHNVEVIPGKEGVQAGNYHY